MKKVTPILLFFMALNLFSQKEANFWYFGKNAGVNFNTTPPTGVTNGQINTDEGCSSFSDFNGNLLFYSDGISVFNKNHVVMNYSNGNPGNDLQGNPTSTQSGMIIPKPGSASIYYLFTVGTDAVLNTEPENPGFNFYTIDISKNNNLGEIIEGPINLAIDPTTNSDLSKNWSEKVAAVQGKECNTFWVVSFVQNTFFAYKIDVSGVRVSDVVTSRVNFTAKDKRGYLNISPDGTKIAFADYNQISISKIGSLLLFDFNNESGAVSLNPEVLIPNFSNNSPYGVSFSRNSKKLYASTYNDKFNIYQFDLNQTDIASSKTKIITKNGYRGALQLGPDGKIYISIPDKTHLDAIENPNAAANKIIYTNNAINLGGKLTGQGLPPFISSLLIPIEITEEVSNQVVNDENLQFCTGDNKTFIPEPLTGTNIMYQWFFNDETIPIDTNPNLTLNNLSKANSGKYTLIVNLTNECGISTQREGAFNIEVFDAASAKKPIDIIFCNTDLTQAYSFDLETLKNIEILDGLDSTVFNVLYFDTLEKANDNIAGTNLAIPYLVNGAGSQIIYARVVNKTVPNTCFAITNFTLKITSEPEPIQPTAYRLCDDTASAGGDTDGVTNSFRLSTKDAEILGTLSALQYTISYHTALADAQTSSTTNAIDKNADYQVTNTQTIYVRVENKVNVDCYIVSDDTAGSSFTSFQLIVDPLPVIKANPVIIKQCDDNPDLISTFNLTEAEISISDNRANETFEYYNTEAEAIAGTPQVANKLMYFVNNTGEAWVRTISNQGCYKISKLELIVSFASDVDYNRNFIACDDFLDADGNNTTSNSDTDGITFFDFSEAEQEVINLFPVLIQPNLEILFYETIADRNASVNEIPDISNHRNNNDPSYINSQIIYIKIKNKVNNNCSGIGQLTLTIQPFPLVNKPSDFNLCDDALSGSTTDGITNSFRLSLKDAEILGTLNALQYTISYHTAIADAQTSSTTNAIDKNADYQVTNTQTIYVRVENKVNVDCYIVSDDTAGSSFTSFQLIVDPLPVIKANPVIIKQCDDNPDLISTFNLTEAEISISDNRANETFEYYNTEAEAIAGTPQVANKLMYFVNNTGEAWVRTISNQGCYKISKLELIVSFASDVDYNRNFIACDDFLDADGNNTTSNSDTDGITFFDFSEAEQEVINLFPVLIQPNLEILFYETIADRNASVNEIPDISNHRNNNDPSYINSQIIYIKIKNKVNNNCSGIGQLTLTVQPFPLANKPSDFNLCDDALSGSTTDGRNSNINLRNRVSDILGATQTETDYIISFHTTAIGANTNADLITNDTNFTNTVPISFTLGDISEQIIYVRVQDRNGNTQCFNNNVTFKIIVNPNPIVSATITPLAVCDVTTPSDSNTRNRIAQNIDLTSKDTEILAGRTSRVAYYLTQQDAENGNEIPNSTDFENTTSETIFPANFNTDDPGIETIFFKVIDFGDSMCESAFSTFELLVYPESNIPINISDYSDCDNTSDRFEDDNNGINGDITLKNKIPEILANYQPSEFADFTISFYTSLAAAEAGNLALAIDENTFENNNNNQTIYVRVENTKNAPTICAHTRLTFNLNITPLPDFKVTPQVLCLNYTNPHILEAENPAGEYNYEWIDKNGTTLGTDQTLIIKEGGEYTVTATDKTTTCSSTKTIYVKESEKATLLEEYVTIIEESISINSQDNISIFIDTLKNSLGKGDYQFALRNEDNGERIPIIGFQDAPLFKNLKGGIYTIIVHDKNGCVADEELMISIIQYPEFFTPNDDGIKDTWMIIGAGKIYYSLNSSINIFDRYGKLIAQLPIDGPGWDGTYNGKLMPSNDYWFNVQLIPIDPRKLTIFKKGHFSLLRK